MDKEKEKPEARRERMLQKELKHSSSSFQGSNLSRSLGGTSWKFTGTMIILLIVGFVIVSLFIN
ncbi:DUF6366 family protein [Paraliobacillus sediminis]|uniref:DUF6366 family protein n=1 Tax=Paraliobacillus sediminis TaxID=1885916 RepID=UPI000E3D0963|nr:DUF6366 family protein [Paraliobacillus sediminis]